MLQLFDHLPHPFWAKDAPAAAQTKETGLVERDLANTQRFVTLEEMMRATFRSESWSGYGPWLLLGGKDCAQSVNGINYGEGVWQALQTILRWEVSGSQLTRALLGPEKVVGSKENPTKILQALDQVMSLPARRQNPLDPAWNETEDQPSSFESLPECYLDNGYDIAGMNSAEYLLTHFALNLLGSNFDFKVYDKQNNLEKTIKQTLAILRMMFAYPVDGGKRKIVLEEYYGKFKQLTFFDRCAEGIIHVCFFPEDFNNQWAKATNWREATTRSITEDPATEKLGVDTPLKTFAEPLRLQIDCENYSDWALHVARSIRVLTTHKLTTQAMDVESFLARKPKFEPKNWSFISQVSLLSNLMISFFEDPDTTLELLEKLDWFQSGAASKKQRLQRIAETIKQKPQDLDQALQEMINQTSELKDFASQLDRAEEKLWKKSSGSSQNSAEPLTLSAFSRLTPLLFALSPVPLEAMLSSVPQPEKREKITMVVSGSVARDASLPAHQILDGLGLRRTQMGADAADALWEIAHNMWATCVREWLRGNNAAAIAAAESAAQMRRESQAMYALDVPQPDKEKLAEILAPAQVSEI